MHSFEFTHENKSRSACAKDQHNHVTDTVTDTNKDTLVPSFCHVDIFNMKTGLKDTETPRLSQFYTNESNGTKGHGSMP